MGRVIRWAAVPTAGLVLAAGVVGVVFVVGMRTKSPAVQRAVRQMNKAFWNPRSMETAGSPGAYASVVHHVGRTTGTAYETPVVPVATDDGLVVPLPYGATADWVKNVLAAGRATVTHEGETHEVDHPEIVPTETIEDLFGASERRTHRIFDVAESLRLHRVEAGAGEAG